MGVSMSVWCMVFHNFLVERGGLAVFDVFQSQAIQFRDMIIVKGIIDLTSVLAAANEPQLTQSA